MYLHFKFSYNYCIHVVAYYKTLQYVHFQCTYSVFTKKVLNNIKYQHGLGLGLGVGSGLVPIYYPVIVITIVRI